MIPMNYPSISRIMIFFHHYNNNKPSEKQIIKMSAKKNMVSDMLLKVIIVGDSGVGKTNLLTYFCEGVFK